MGQTLGETRTVPSSCLWTFFLSLLEQQPSKLRIKIFSDKCTGVVICRFNAPWNYFSLLSVVCSGNEAYYYVFKPNVIRKVHWLWKINHNDSHSQERLFLQHVLPRENLEREFQSRSQHWSLGSQHAGCGRVRAKPSSPSLVSPLSSPTTAKFAEEACALLTSPKFEACHHAVAPLPYLQNCHYDVCSCSDGKDCLCNAVANYAAACARKGVHVAWREPSFCGGCPPCPPLPP